MSTDNGEPERCQSCGRAACLLGTGSNGCFLPDHPCCIKAPPTRELSMQVSNLSSIFPMSQLQHLVDNLHNRSTFSPSTAHFASFDMALIPDFLFRLSLVPSFSLSSHHELEAFDGGAQRKTTGFMQGKLCSGFGLASKRPPRVIRMKAPSTSRLRLAHSFVLV